LSRPDHRSGRAARHHYTKALTYAQAAGSASAALVDHARLALRAAGDHAIAIGTDALAAR
jgi:hypothetical protein